MNEILCPGCGARVAALLRQQRGEGRGVVDDAVAGDRHAAPRCDEGAGHGIVVLRSGGTHRYPDHPGILPGYPTSR